jgi:Ni,Fe-hydrogenase III small subunit
MPDPKLVVAVGDCGRDGGIFGCSYASCGGVASVLPVDVVVPGCPPPPLDILRGILTAVSDRAPAAIQGPAGQTT